jgi:hypothetical protein
MPVALPIMGYGTVAERKGTRSACSERCKKLIAKQALRCPAKELAAPAARKGTRSACYERCKKLIAKQALRCPAKELAALR